jgi:hypothetical protein
MKSFLWKLRQSLLTHTNVNLMPYNTKPISQIALLPCFGCYRNVNWQSLTQSKLVWDGPFIDRGCGIGYRNPINKDANCEDFFHLLEQIYKIILTWDVSQADLDGIIIIMSLLKPSLILRYYRLNVSKHEIKFEINIFGHSTDDSLMDDRISMAPRSVRFGVRSRNLNVGQSLDGCLKNVISQAPPWFGRHVMHPPTRTAWWVMARYPYVWSITASHSELTDREASSFFYLGSLEK